jgi:hypothetical protein
MNNPTGGTKCAKIPSSAFASPQFRIYPIFDESHLETAITHIITTKGITLEVFSSEHREEICRNICLKARELKVNLPKDFHEVCVSGKTARKIRPFIFR